MVSPSFYFWYRGRSTDGQSFPSISGTGDGALMVSPFLLFLAKGMEH
jgi:hypothetical protein